MDNVRKLILDKLVERGQNMSNVSIKIGKNHAYLQQFLNRGVPAELPEKVRHSLATELGLDERYLRLSDGSLKKTSAGSDRDKIKTVPLVGYVAAGSETHFFNDSGELDRLPAPDRSTDETVVVEVRGESLGPLFDKCLVFYDKVERPINSDHINKLCVVGLTDGRILVKKVQRSKSKSGLYHLISNGFDAPILDVEIEWAARVKSLVPR
jgi:hypothetical protein